jgi:hypothetical protein
MSVFPQDRLSVFLHFLIIPGLVLYILRIDSLVNQIQNEHYVQQTEFKKIKNKKDEASTASSRHPSLFFFFFFLHVPRKV